MKHKIIALLIYLGFIGLLAIFAACGGGGGGDHDDGGIKVPISYTGSTSQAVITTNNAVAIMQHLDSYGYSTEPVEVAYGIIEDAELFSNPRDIPYLRIDSPCGGSYELEFNLSEGTGSFTGNVKFSGYCIDWWDDNLYLTGTSSFEGSHVETQDLWSFNIKLGLDDISSQMGDMSLKFIYGNELYEESYEMTEGNENYTFNYVLIDNNQSKTYWAYDTQFFINFIYYVGPNNLTLDGRFYDYDYGFVDIETDGTIDLSFDETQTGSILILGKESKAKLTFNADGSNILEVDADNDGEFDDGSFENVL